MEEPVQITGTHDDGGSARTNYIRARNGTFLRLNYKELLKRQLPILRAPLFCSLRIARIAHHARQERERERAASIIDKRRANRYC